jgi:hypothetical protein
MFKLLAEGLVLFWSLWWSVIVVTNLMEALRALGVLAEDWKFASGNYSLISQTTAIYDLPAWVNGLLFVCVILWQMICCVLFWRTFRNLREKPTLASSDVIEAFVVSLALWAALIIADEIFISYEMEGIHLRILLAQMVTLLLLLHIGEKEARRAVSDNKPH